MSRVETSDRQTKHQRLNTLLKQNASAFGFPEFRTQIGASGANQDWLRKAMKRHPSADPEIIQLLDLPLKRLLEEHVGT